MPEKIENPIITIAYTKQSFIFLSGNKASGLNAFHDIWDPLPFHLLLCHLQDMTFNSQSKIAISYPAITLPFRLANRRKGKLYL